MLSVQSRDGIAYAVASVHLARAVFDRFRAYLVGESDGVPKDADWAAAISGIDGETLRALARRMAASRTMISVSSARVSVNEV